MLVGHDEPWRAWHAALAGARMHHGWILAGRRGLGKASFALDAAAELVGAGRAGQPAATVHPDILVMAPLADNEAEEEKRISGKPFKSKRNISVDQIRAMQQRLITRPTYGARRAIIIDASDDLESSGFNALLKSLEEPPAGTVFLLVAHRLGRLPATIRSRCRVLRFAELEAAQLATVLAAQAPDASAEARTAALAVACGSPGAALDFLARGLVGAQRLMVRLAREGDPDLALRGALLGEVGQRPDREQQLALIEAARMVVVGELEAADRAHQSRLVEAHAGLARLLAQAPTANFDPNALVLEIGGLLASIGEPRAA